jgi:hypothetical protein
MLKRVKNADDFLMICWFDVSLRFMNVAFIFSLTSQPSRGKGREYELVWLCADSETKTGRTVLSSMGESLTNSSEVKTWSRPR